MTNEKSIDRTRKQKREYPRRITHAQEFFPNSADLRFRTDRKYSFTSSNGRTYHRTNLATGFTDISIFFSRVRDVAWLGESPFNALVYSELNAYDSSGSPRKDRRHDSCEVEDHFNWINHSWQTWKEKQMCSICWHMRVIDAESICSSSEWISFTNALWKSESLFHVALWDSLVSYFHGDYFHVYNVLISLSLINIGRSYGFENAPFLLFFGSRVLRLVMQSVDRAFQHASSVSFIIPNHLRWSSIIDHPQGSVTTHNHCWHSPGREPWTISPTPDVSGNLLMPRCFCSWISAWFEKENVAKSSVVIKDCTNARTRQ